MDDMIDLHREFRASHHQRFSHPKTDSPLVLERHHPNMSSLPSAPSPFNRPDADLVLRSSDGIDFRAHKVILTIASPFFEDMLSMPQPKVNETDDSSGIPIIPFEEDTTTLNTLLQYCYPGPDPSINNREDLNKVMQAAEKYQFNDTSSRLEERYLVISQDEITKNPIPSFLLACRYKWGRLARACAKAALYFSLDSIAESAERVDISCYGNEYVKLQRYHLACRMACQSFVSDLDTSYSSYSDRHYYQCIADLKSNANTNDSFAFIGEFERKATEEAAGKRNASDAMSLLAEIQKLKDHANSVVLQTTLDLPF